MSGWSVDTDESDVISIGRDVAGEGQRHRSGGGSPNKPRILNAKTLLLIWTLFVLGFVLILSAAIAFSARFTGAGAACLSGGLGCLLVASVWQWRLSSARLLELGAGGHQQLAAAAAGYPHVPAPGEGNIQDDAEGPAQGFHF